MTHRMMREFRGRTATHEAPNWPPTWNGETVERNVMQSIRQSLHPSWEIELVIFLRSFDHLTRLIHIFHCQTLIAEPVDRHVQSYSRGSSIASMLQTSSTKLPILLILENDLVKCRSEMVSREHRLIFKKSVVVELQTISMISSKIHSAEHLLSHRWARNLGSTPGYSHVHRNKSGH